jgi:hypothetical protein
MPLYQAECPTLLAATSKRGLSSSPEYPLANFDFGGECEILNCLRCAF